MTKKIITSLTLSLVSLLSYAQDCYTLVWSDEFNGTTLDETKWNYDIGTGYPDLQDWGNGEIQYFTNKPENIQVSNGSLKITALEENFGYRSYSSSRIRTKGTFDFRYGRIEARIKIPNGNGLWPAFWMLPTENVYGPWPKSGELDVMENFGQNNYTFSTIHYQDGNGNHKWNGQNYGVTHNQYRTFAAIWEKDYISFYSDWNWVGDERPSALNGGTWPFNEDFYLILNLALGGSAKSVAGTVFPKTMEIDYVRVYQKTADIDIQGPPQVYANQTVSYTLPSNSTATYNWSIPNGGTILSGQGTNKVTVKWGTTAGNISCNSANWSGDIAGVNSTCPAAQHSKAISLISNSCDIPLLNFDGVQKMVPTMTDGLGGTESMFEKNISKTTINTSPLVGRFARVGNEPYDVLKLDFKEPIDASNLRSGINKFIMDVYTSAGPSIPVTIEFVNRSKNNLGYPKGIHSQYTAVINTANAWNTLTFKYINTADWTVQGDEVDGINILFNPNSNTTDKYYFDNLRTQIPLNVAVSGLSVINSPDISNTHQYSIPNEIGSSYQWTVGANTVISSGQNTNALNVSFNNGMYSNTLEVTQTNSMLCDYSFSKVVTVNDLTSISADALANSIQVYPNPIADELIIRLDLEEASGSTYKLLDLSGQLIESGNLDSETSLTTNDLIPGVYFLTISNSILNQTYKIIKK